MRECVRGYEKKRESVCEREREREREMHLSPEHEGVWVPRGTLQVEPCYIASILGLVLNLIWVHVGCDLCVDAGLVKGPSFGTACALHKCCYEGLWNVEAGHPHHHWLSDLNPFLILLIAPLEPCHPCWQHLLSLQHPQSTTPHHFTLTLLSVLMHPGHS